MLHRPLTGAIFSSPLNAYSNHIVMFSCSWSSFEHIWKGRDNFSDERNRKEVMEVLVKMIKAWLDENYPDMPESERQAMATAMDVSLIERKKEESMKTFYEINNVIRMSFIEMEYMKKVRDSGTVRCRSQLYLCCVLLTFCSSSRRK